MRAGRLTRLAADVHDGEKVSDDDRGAAMLTALMLIMVVGSLSLLVLGTLVAQVQPASLVQKTTRTIFAAETGTQVALGELRSHLADADTNKDVYGDPARLPCSLAGAVGEASAELGYAVTIQYFASDPSTFSLDERQDRDITCGLNGTQRGVAEVPAYAVITSQGLAAGIPGLATDRGDRTLETQYAFQRTNKNVPGGLFRTSDLAFCLRADTATADSPVRYTSACADDRSTLNLWVHDRDSNVVLASTLAEGATPLCLAVPAASGDVVLDECAVVGAQLFTYRAYFRYEGQNSQNDDAAGACLWAGSSTASLENLPLRVSSGGCVQEDQAATKVVQPWWSWNPEAAVGAGSASQPESMQLINYAEFGRCLEVTQEYLFTDRMGIGPCKQTLPGSGNRRWNQVWVRTEPVAGATSSTTQLVVHPEWNPYETWCLTTPGDDTTSVFPTLTYCDASRQDQQWLRRTQTSDYSTSYLLVDRYGRCLGGGPTYTPDGSELTSVVVEPCDGSRDQKWNAPPNTTPPGQSNTNED